MIREGVCKYCSESLRANGDDKFTDLVNNHFKIKHTIEYKQLIKLMDDANGEFKELREKYPELFFSFSYFQINWNNLLSKPQT